LIERVSLLTRQASVNSKHFEVFGYLSGFDESDRSRYVADERSSDLICVNRLWRRRALRPEYFANPILTELRLRHLKNGFDDDVAFVRGRRADQQRHSDVRRPELPLSHQDFAQ